MEDRNILDLYWRRDSSAIEETDRKYGGKCRGIAYGILSSREDAEECVNDTYLTAWNTIPPQRPAFLSAYLCRITRNLSIDRVRGQAAQKRGGGEHHLVLDELAECVASSQTVERELEARELGAELNKFLYTLSQSDRIIFAYRYWMELPTGDIARRLRVSEGKVRMSLFRSRKKLHKYLTEEGLL